MSGVIIPFEGKHPKIHPSAFIAENAVIIGDVEIGPESSVWYNCVVRGDTNIIRIGARTNIQDGTVIHVNGDIEEPRDMATIIGDDVTVGHMCLLHACKLEDRCFVGMQASVIDQAHIEPEGMVAAGALLTPRKRIGAGELWAGNPAKLLRPLREKEWAHLSAIAPHYVELGQRYLAERAKNQKRAG